MDSRPPKPSPRLPRRDLLKAGAAAGAMMSVEPVLAPGALRAQPKRSGILRAWGYCVGVAGSWQPYVKNYAPNPSFDCGSRAAALWLDKA